MTEKGPNDKNPQGPTSPPLHYKDRQYQVNVYMKYKHDDEIVQYFCFPEYRFCVALRPGDWLFFNPAVHHCLSQKSKEYNDEIVHVSTCYVK